jgi:hypothetical protein
MWLNAGTFVALPLWDNVESSRAGRRAAPLEGFRIKLSDDDDALPGDSAESGEERAAKTRRWRRWGGMQRREEEMRDGGGDERGR